MQRWTVTLPEERRAARAVVVEADVLDVLAGALVFTLDHGALVVAYGSGAWDTVVEGGPGEAPDGAQVFERSR
jgi:hypothetical protein